MNKRFMVFALVLCSAAAYFAHAEDGSSPAVTGPMQVAGLITAHESDGDTNSSCHHSIVVIAASTADKSGGGRPMTIEFNRLEPVLAVGRRYGFTYKPVMDSDGNVIRSNGRQIFELDENSVQENPEVLK